MLMHVTMKTLSVIGLYTSAFSIHQQIPYAVGMVTSQPDQKSIIVQCTYNGPLEE